MLLGQVVNGGVGQLLHPGLELVGAVEGTFGVSIEQSFCLVNGSTGLDGFGDLLLGRDDAVEFLDAPGVGLFQVKGGAYKLTGVKGIALAAHSICLGCVGAQGVFEVGEKFAVAFLGGRSPLGSTVGVLGGCFGYLFCQSVEETALCNVGGYLLDNDINLANRCYLTCGAGGF